MLQVLDIQSSSTASKILKQHSDMTHDPWDWATTHIQKDPKACAKGNFP